MPCTTLLVGKNASYDGSTLMARNEDSGSGYFTPKKFIAVLERHHINTTVRRELGADINAACGQLRRADKGEGATC